MGRKNYLDLEEMDLEEVGPVETGKAEVQDFESIVILAHQEITLLVVVVVEGDMVNPGDVLMLVKGV